MSSPPLIRFEEYALHDARGRVLLELSLEIGHPGVVAVVGAAGSGKSLLLAAIAGRLPRGVTATGRRLVEGLADTSDRPLCEPPIHHDVHLPRTTLFRALIHGAGELDAPERRIEEALSSLGLWERFQERLLYPVRMLSRTEQILVALCRRLVVGEPAVLLDDPIRPSNPDDLNAFLATVLAVARQVPVVWAAQSLRGPAPIAHRIVALHEGKVVADGPSDRIVVMPGDAAEAALETAAGRTIASGLDELYQELLDLGSRAETAVHQAVQALTDQNLSIAREVVESDHHIDQRERQIIARAMGILGRTAPVGKELRVLITVIQAAMELERIADHAVNISEVTLAIGDEPLIKPLIDIPRMAEKAQAMVRHSLDALVRREERLAQEVLTMDAPVDALYRELFEELLGFITDGGDAYRAGQALYLLFVARYLERVADHATNIAEHVIFMLTGQRVRRQTNPEDDMLPHPFLPR